MKESFIKLNQLCKKLREECPWDRKQTMNSYYRYILDEANEFCEAVEKGDKNAIKDELGDIMYNLLFIADIAEKEGMFSLKDAMNHAHEKYTRRHPHVFKGESKKIEDIERRWHEIKKEERNGNK